MNFGAATRDLSPAGSGTDWKLVRRQAGRPARSIRRIAKLGIFGAALVGFSLSLVSPGLALEACFQGAWQTVGIVSVRDARTLILSDGRLLRPAGIESMAVFADSSSKADIADGNLHRRLQELTQSRISQIRILSSSPDRHGRLPALLKANESLVQERLIADGMAVFMPEAKLAGGASDPLDACGRELLKSEARARFARLGAWSNANLRVAPASPEALASHFGHFIIFQGIVRSVGTRRERTFIDFGRHWRSDVTVEIASARRAHFGGKAGLEALSGKMVRIRGFVEEKAGPMVPVAFPLQMEVLESTANATPEK